ncbi:MAG: hypothetical protein ACOC9Q_03415 [bacterium]
MARQTTFASFIKKERARLDKARKEALANRAAVEKELDSIESELKALDAYQQVAGAPPRRGPGKGATGKRGAAKGARRGTGRRGEKRQAVLNLIQNSPVGLSRGEILVQMGAKGNRSAEQSVSNALSALKKSEKVNSREGKYVPA